jgi:geranyl-CoA carboxylase alpha subunit
MSPELNGMRYRPFKKVLIANRGEIACRVMRAARASGLETVAVYSEQDRDSLHVAMADQAIYIGPSQASASYLNIPALCSAIKSSGADAVHPGYGFLAENADFAEAVIAAGAVWVGPTPQSIRSMGNKARAKEMMLASGVRCIPGYEGLDQSDSVLLKQAEVIGFPLMVKAAAGGGGRGMRLVQSAEQLPAAIERARVESLQAFSSDELILERAITQARHIEIQIAGDVFGHVIHLGERDCSVQRRHQKIIEESPSPAVDHALRKRMGDMAVQAARSIHYVGVGTIECLLSADGEFYFMEMNTRLQVEHAVTEAVYGVDLVAMQFELAAGRALALTQEQVLLKGHAIEVRLTAEDVAAGFLPQSGVVHRWESVEHLEGIRVDHCLRDGTVISPYYDSMIAKIIAVGETREQARARLSGALKRCVVLGIPTNQSFLYDCLNQAEFVAGHVTTDFVALARASGLLDAPQPTADTLIWAAAAAHGLVEQFTSPDHARHESYERHLASVISQVRLRGTSITLALPPDTQPSDTQHADPQQQDVWNVSLQARSDGLLQGRLDAGRAAGHGQVPGPWIILQNRPHDFVSVCKDGLVHVFVSGLAWTFKLDDPDALPHAQTSSGVMRAPLGARVASVLVHEGDMVKTGDTLVVLEAMKMEHSVVAPFDGQVTGLQVKQGTQVRAGVQLMTVTA